MFCSKASFCAARAAGFAAALRAVLLDGLAATWVVAGMCGVTAARMLDAWTTRRAILTPMQIAMTVPAAMQIAAR